MTITGASVVSGNTIAVNFTSGGSPGTYDLTNVSFAPGSAQTFAFGTDSSTGLGYIQIMPTVINWSGSVSTDYGTGGNWVGGILPSANDTVNFTDHPGTVTGTGSALSINVGAYNFNNVGTWTFNGTTLTVDGAPNPPFLPFAAGFYMDTVLNGATLNATGGSTNISNMFGATVTAQGGATVTTGNDNIGGGSGQSGALVLTGSGTDWTEQTGASVSGTVPGFMTVAGGPGSNGSLTVTAGALLTSGAGGSIASNTSAVGSATVSAGGRWLMNGASYGLSVGYTGNGTLTVNNGTVSTAGFLGIGGGIGGQGAVAVTAGGTLSGSNGMNVGGNGAGTLVVTGASVSTTGYTGIGQNTGGSGTVSVSGGGMFSSSNGFDVGASGAGTLTLSDGMVSAGGFVGIGQNPGSTGTVDVSGAGSLLDITNNLNIGNAGVGLLTLGNSTTLSVSGTITIGVDGSLNQLGGTIDPSVIGLVAGGRLGGDGPTTVGADISNASTLYAASGIETVNTPLITAPVGKTGVLEIDTNGELVLNVSSVDTTQTVAFTDATGILSIGSIGGFHATINQFTLGDDIIIQGRSVASTTYNSTTHVLSLFDGSHGAIGTLQFGASVAPADLLPDGKGGVGTVVCFCAGTMIAKPDGEVPVERLAVGDLRADPTRRGTADRLDRHRPGAGATRAAQRRHAGDRAQGRAGRQRAAP